MNRSILKAFIVEVVGTTGSVALVVTAAVITLRWTPWGLLLLLPGVALYPLAHHNRWSRAAEAEAAAARSPAEKHQ